MIEWQHKIRYPKKIYFVPGELAARFSRPNNGDPFNKAQPDNNDR